jgi:4-coumarate--CoA ligase
MVKTVGAGVGSNWEQARRCSHDLYAKPHLCACGIFGCSWKQTHLQWRESGIHSLWYVNHRIQQFQANTDLEMVHQVSNTQAQIILAHPSLAKTAVTAARKAGLPDGRVFLFSDVPNPSIEGLKDWRSLLPSEAEADAYQFPPLSEKEATTTTATVNYSSGTTGLPKGVEVSHHNLIANLDQTIYMRYLRKPWSATNRPREVWVGFLPLYHAYGQLYTIAMAQKLSIPVYIMKSFVYADFLEVIQTHKVTHLQVAPPIMVMLSKRPETAKYDLSSVTDILCGAAPLSKELQNEISKKLNCEIVQGWGMTEVTCGAIHVPGGVSDEYVPIFLSNIKARVE